MKSTQFVGNAHSRRAFEYEETPDRRTRVLRDIQAVAPGNIAWRLVDPIQVGFTHTND
jgi:hypothetical protein